MATSVPDVILSNQPDGGASKIPRGTISLVFDIHTSKRYWFQKQQVSDLSVLRSKPARLRDLTEHLESQLFLPNGYGRKFLLVAKYAPSETGHQEVVPLVCEEIWAALLQQYPHSRLEVSVDQQRSLVVTHARSCREWLFGRQIKNIDIPSYLPSSGLAPGHILNLCHAIFEKRVSIKHSLRKGVWMHLVGVFPPELKERDERERYIEKLRMVYDSLKGKWKGAQSAQVEQLVEAVRRDAMRTDPSHPFYSRASNTTESLSPDSIANPQDQSNVQKLVNIVTIYILEHEEISYTQGMTDLLSPFLYVMKREADAYICFAAMVERIKSHFNMWCEGTLLKIERLRHICEVLDPELFHFLTNKIEEDAFALFFGMVLIECRREFAFDDSFQLLEAIWAGSMCMKGEPISTLTSPAVSTSEWARFMTYDSKEVIQQAFGETQSPYSAQPLPRSYSDTTTSLAGNRVSTSRNPSMLSQMSLGSQVHRHNSSMPEMIPSSNMSDVSNADIEPKFSVEIHQHTVTVDIEPDKVEPPHIIRPRSYTDPNIKVTHELESRDDTTTLGLPLNLSPSHLSMHSRSESELYDSFSNSKLPISTVQSKTPTELADLSSVSSGTVSTSGNHQSSQALSKSETPPNRNHSPPDDTTGIYNGGGNNKTVQMNDDSSSSLTPPPRSASSAYQTANDESSSSQSSQSQSPRLKRAVRKGERITTESIPDESYEATTNQHDTHKDTLPTQPQPISSSFVEQSSLLFSGSGHHTDAEGSRSRITPVAFFDVMDTIASSAPGTTENSGVFDPSEFSDGGLNQVRHIRANSDVSVFMSQLNLGEQTNPGITRERSLTIPISDCFSLFVCMAILSQHRHRIMKSTTDFVGLSVIMNTQAGQQNVEKTLYIARDLYRMYRDYQARYNTDPHSLDTWLDDSCCERQGVTRAKSGSGCNLNRQNSAISTNSVLNNS